MTREWSPDAVRRICENTACTDLVTAASIFGIGRTKAYDLHRRRELPFATIEAGHRIVVPTAQLLDLLGLEPERQPDVPWPNLAQPRHLNVAAGQ